MLCVQGGVYAVMPKDPNVPGNPRPAQQELGLHVDSSIESLERIGLVGLVQRRLSRPALYI